MLESIRSVEIDEVSKASKTEANSPNKQPIDYKKAAAVLKEIENKVFIGGLPRNGTY
jgi:hypothetical protein